jgi:hypothetical protein
MPFKSEKQRRYMHANLPKIAKRWERDYAGGGIARLGFYNGNIVAPYPNPMLTNMQKMNPLALDVMTGKHQPGISPHRGGYQSINPYAGEDIDQTYMEGDFNVSPNQPAWYQKMFNKAGQGIRGLKNKFTGAYDTSQNFIKKIMDNTLIGRIGAGFDATNPKAFNYNPLLQGQIDFMKGPEGFGYGVMDSSGLNKITGGALAGKNLQSMFGSNDLGAMYDKSIAQTEKTLANLSKQWSRLQEEDPEAYARKVAIHKSRLQKKKNEQKKYFDSLKKKTTSGGGKKTYITKKDQGGDGGGKTYTGGAKAGTTGSWSPGGTYNAPSQPTRHHALAQGGIVSLWPK